MECNIDYFFDLFDMKETNQFLRAGWGVCGLLLTLSLNAQETRNTTTAKVQRIDNVTVTARCASQKTATGSPVQLLRKDNQHNLGLQNIADAVRRFSDTNVRDYGGINQDEQVKIFQNPEKTLEANDKIFIQGYRDDYTYPVIVYNRAPLTFQKIDKGTLMAEYNDVEYVIYSQTDWTTGTSTHTLYSYNARTDQKNDRTFLQISEELKTPTIYMLIINHENGEFYIGSSDFTAYSDVYRFKHNGTLTEKFANGGISPCKTFFID